MNRKRHTAAWRPVTLHQQPARYWRTSICRYAITVDAHPVSLRRAYRRNRVGHMTPHQARLVVVIAYAIDWQQTPRTAVAE